MIEQMNIERLCEAPDCFRSSYYYQPSQAGADQVLTDAIEGILG